MSSAMVAQVLRLSNPTLSRPQKNLLLVLAYHTNPETGVAYPGHRLLAQELLVTERQVRNLIRRLEKTGWLEVRTGQGRGHLSVFRLKFPDEVIHRKEEILPHMPAEKRGNREPEKGKSVVVPLHEVERERKQPIAHAPEKPEMQSRFWCADCEYAIPSCEHRVIYG